MLDDFLDKFNLIDRLQGFLFGMLTFIPHRRAHKGRKVGPYVVDPGWREIRICRDVNTGAEVEEYLRGAGVSIGGRRVTSQEVIFVVKQRQAQWAEYLLLRRGDVFFGENHQWIDQRNARWAQQHAAPVPLWAERKRGHR